jgi:hypothetical protein
MKNRILTVDRCISRANENTFGSVITATTGSFRAEFNNYETQEIITLGEIHIVNNGNSEQVFYGPLIVTDELLDVETAPLYITTHDTSFYVSDSKKKIKKAIAKACGCRVR